MKTLPLLGVISMLACPLAALGQTTIFSDNFGSSSMNPTAAAPGTLTSTKTAYEIASSKTGTSTAISGNVLTLATSQTSSGFTEAQALFTASPITLSSPGQYVEIYYTFKDTANVLNGTANNNTGPYIGLFDSGGSAPTNGILLWNSGIGTGTTAVTGGTQNWIGYQGSIVWSSNALEAATIATRPPQNQGNNQNQELLFASVYATHTNVVTLAGVLNEPVLTVGNYYTVALQLTYVSSTALAITNVLYNGAGLGGSIFSSGGYTATYGGTSTVATSGTANGPEFTFDSLAVGYRSGQPTVTSTFPITNITVIDYIPTLPTITSLTNQTVVQGSNTVLNPTITGVPTPTFQWQLTNGVSGFTNIPGAASSTLALNNVQYSQDGYVYQLVAGNLVGSVTNDMTLSVIVTPSITGLGSQSDAIGSTVTISPTVSGVPTPTLQWQTNGVNLADGMDANGSTISGSQASTLSITGAQPGDSGTYSLIASNSAGIVTNSMTLLISSSPGLPIVTGPTGITVIQGNSGTFAATVSGNPVPTEQWLDPTYAPILNATSTTLTLNNVQYSQNGLTYSIVASNSVGSVTNGATLTVIVPPDITTQPTNLIVLNTQPASFTVAATGVPNPTYQWFSNTVAVSSSLNNTATNATFTFAGASPASSGSSYYVQISNSAGITNSANATLTVNSAMSVASLAPADNAAGVGYDTPLYLTFSQAPKLNSSGKIRIYNVTNSTTPVDTIDLSLDVSPNASALNVQPRTIAGETFTNYPVIITGNQAAIYPHLDLITSNQTYYVTVDNGAFTDTAGASFAGITATNVWLFATKVGGPANPTNMLVAADGSGDFVTVQGAVDSLPGGNTMPTLVTINNGNYVEIVDVHSKNNITLRGQTRNGAIVGYANNANVQGSTHFRMAMKINGNDISLDNLTVTNRTPVGGAQAEALMLESGVKRFIFNNCNLGSFQDTLLANGSTGAQGYFKNDQISGQFDYIWGGGDLFFTNCVLLTELGAGGATSGGNLTAARTDNGATGNWPGYYSLNASNGFSFVNCRLTRAVNTIVNTTLADSNGTTNGNVAWINCSIDANYIAPATGVLNSQLLWEYGNSNLTDTATASYGLGVGDSAPELTVTDPRYLAAANANTWLLGWQPQLAPNILTNPASLSVSAGQAANFNVSATGIPDPTYQWLVNGSPISGATGSSFTIASAVRTNGGSYSVAVSNGSGTVTSAVAVLTYNNTAPVAGSTFTMGALLGIPVTVQIVGGKYPPTDVDGDTLTITGVAGAANGTVTTDGTNVTYTATSGASDSFTYTVSDGYGGTAMGTVNVTINSNTQGYNQISLATPGGGTNVFTFLGIPGYNYALDLTTNLTPPVIWLPQVTNPAANNGYLTFTNVNNLPQSYYRSRYVQ